MHPTTLPVDPRFLAALRHAVRVAAAIILTGLPLLLLDLALRSLTAQGSPIVPPGAFEFAVMTVTVQHSDTRRALGIDFRDRARSTAIGCALGALVWNFGGETLAGVAIAPGWREGRSTPSSPPALPPVSPVCWPSARRTC